jgi:DNA-binding CsgD family transcriptional regulator
MDEDILDADAENIYPSAPSGNRLFMAGDHRALSDKDILDRMPALVHIRNQRSGDIVWCNASWERILGLPRDEIIANSSEILRTIIHPDDFAQIRISNEHYLSRNMENFGGLIRVRFPGHKEWRWLTGISTIISKDGAGIPLETLAVFLDFSQVVHTESQLREALQEVLRKRYSEALIKITGREKHVLQLITSGLNSEQIAAKLFISRHTVESHRKNIRMKLNVKNTSELISLAKDLGI